MEFTSPLGGESIIIMAVTISSIRKISIARNTVSVSMDMMIKIIKIHQLYFNAIIQFSNFI